jgi:23S rRNA (adenine1618-N6)-methyltransferase
MHPRNLHSQGYDFSALATAYPALNSHLSKNVVGKTTIDYADPKAVKCLNAALLAHHYQVHTWDVPDQYLCPPIPGRADYIHCIADLLGQSNPSSIANKASTVGLDIGVGANMIYPILGSQIYGWRFVGSDIDPTSVKSARLIAEANPKLRKKIEIRQQSNPSKLFEGIIGPKDNFSFTMCNPPFHGSAEEAATGSRRKTKSLARHKEKYQQKHYKEASAQSGRLNFAGKSNELWCEGGEAGFVKRMVNESIHYASQVQWFTCLLSKKTNIEPTQKLLQKIAASETKIIEMTQGNKISRFIAWRF